MSEKRCFGCMLIKQNSPVCEHCGYDERKPNAPHQLPPGTILNNQYVVGRVLGQGGFGITYMGWDQFLGIPVAIKEFYPSNIVIRDSTRSTSVFLTSDHVADHFVSNRDRFVREATSLAMLGRSPDAANIVRVQNLVQANATAYIIMEYVDGTDMRGLMRQKGGVLTLEETLRLLLPLMNSLETVHNNHLVHRDISPDNIMVLPNGSTKLIDFGAAHEFRQDDMKSTEAILKHGFAPPEQYQRKGELGPWTDVYALCATIYYCTTGLLPPSATDRVMGSEEFEWDKIPGITAGMIRALQKGTAIHKDNRIQTMGQLRQALESSNNTPTADPWKTVPLQQEPLRTVPAQEYKQTTHTTPVVPSGISPAPDSSISRSHPPAAKKRYLPIVAVVAAVAALFLGWQALRPDSEPTIDGKTDSVDRYAATAPASDTLQVPSDSPASSPEMPDSIPEHGVLMADEWVKENPVVFGSSYSRNSIATVTFLNSLENVPANTWDVSAEKNGSVLAWAEKSPERSDLYDLYIAGNGSVTAPENCDSMFCAYSNVTAFRFNNCFDTSGATVMSAMFASCTAIKKLDLNSFDFENVLSVGSMFYNCSSMESMTAETWDTSGLTNLYSMFSSCGKLTNVTFGNFNVSNVTRYDNFASDKVLINGKPWMQYFYPDVTAVPEDPELLKYSNTSWYPNLLVNPFGAMDNFLLSDYQGKKVYGSNIPNTKIRSITFLDTLAQEPSDSWDVSADQSGRVKAWAISNGSLYDLYIAAEGGINGSAACKRMFVYFTALEEINFGTAFHTETAESMHAMFYSCTSLTSVDLSSFRTGNVTDMGYMFEYATNLTALDLSSFDTSSVTNMKKMFEECSSLESLDVTSFDTSKVTNMDSMFSRCTSLKTLDLHSFDISNVTEKAFMFLSCGFTTVNNPNLMK